MELHQLRYIVAVARAGNFSRAAEQCHVSQPSLSQQILKLEAELGEKLFDRMKREARLTPHGKAFLPRAIRILQEVEAANREAAAAKHTLQGPVTIGVLPTIAPYLLPEAMTRFTKKHPAVEIVVHEDTTSTLIKTVLAYELDVAIVSQPINDERLAIRELFSEELLLALPVRHHLANKRSIGINDLSGERFIVMKEGHCLGDQVLHFCERRELHPQISFRSAQLETVQAFVRDGLGISLIPEMAVGKSSTGSLVYRSLNAPKPERKIVAIWPKQRPLGRGAGELVEEISKGV